MPEAGGSAYRRGAARGVYPWAPARGERRGQCREATEWRRSVVRVLRRRSPAVAILRLLSTGWRPRLNSVVHPGQPRLIVRSTPRVIAARYRAIALNGRTPLGCTTNAARCVTQGGALGW